MTDAPCPQCLTITALSVVWYRGQTTRGRSFFRRELMCFDCREEIRRDGGDVR